VISEARYQTPPVLVLAYRRPDLVAEVMRTVSAAAPERLFLACDGPHPDRPAEAALVEATRTAMENAITWDCQVYRRYSKTNQGCRRGVEGAISWFFAQVEEGIILEDDCIPHPDFFPYCAELLDRYRHDPRVMHISGDSALPHPSSRSGASYVFSHEALVWGWATWRKAWERYDADLRSWEQLRTDPLLVRQTFGSRPAAQWWSRTLDQLLFEGTPDSWAYRWSFSVRKNRGVCIVPGVNLVSNVGFREDSTHTFSPKSPRANVAASAVLPLRHPHDVRIDNRSDGEFQRRLRGFAPNPVVRMVRRLAEGGRQRFRQALPERLFHRPSRHDRAV
jgi:hypothetical protein